MNKLAITLVLAFALASAVWTYKGNELQDSQVLVFVTGTDVSTTPEGEAAIVTEEIPTIVPGSEVDVKYDGTFAKCRTSAFTSNSVSSGSYDRGSLTNAVQMPLSGSYVKVKPGVQAWTTTEVANGLELAGCATVSAYGAKVRVNELSAQNGGRLQYAPGRFHVTHQNGLDADTALFCKSGTNIYDCGDWTKFDAASNWLFVRTLAAKTSVRRILLDQRLITKLKTYADANDPGYDPGIFTQLLRHYTNHYNHFHVQFHCLSSDRCTKLNGGYRGPGIEGPEVGGDENEDYSDPGVTPPLDDTGPVASGGTGAPLTDDQLLRLADSRATHCLTFDELHPVIQKCVERYGINEYVVRAIITVESGGGCGGNGGQPRADNPGSTASGLMQMLRGTIDEVNRFRTRANTEPRLAYSDLIYPSKSICAGMQYLAINWKAYGADERITTTADLVGSYFTGGPGYDSVTGARKANRDKYMQDVKAAYRRLTGGELPATPEEPGKTINMYGNPPAPPLVS